MGTSKDFQIDFIGIGPQKTGSTWLHEALSGHPQLCMPLATKELQFFDQFYEQGIETAYEPYFSHWQEGQLRGEVTPKYFDTPEAPERIAKHFPSVKLFCQLRAPIARTRSLFVHYASKGEVSQDFDKAIVEREQILTAGDYSYWVPRWLERFSKEQVKLLLMEDIAADPVTVLADALRFVGVDDSYRPENLGERQNKAGTTMAKYPKLAKAFADTVVFMKRNKLHKVVEAGKALGLRKVYEGGKEPPALTDSQKLFLLERYANDIEYVEDLLGRKLESWKRL